MKVFVRIMDLLAMRTALRLLCFTLTFYGLLSCSPRKPVKVSPSIVVSPYNRLSDRELVSHYLNPLLSELQRLDGQMNSANKERDFSAVSRNASTALQKARSARRIAGSIRNQDLRKQHLAAIDIRIQYLVTLIEIAGQE